MIYNETCLHGAVLPKTYLSNLHKNQGGSGRHKCPTCSYEKGFHLGSSQIWNSYNDYAKSVLDPESCPLGSVTSSAVLASLGENQGGTGRHRCTNCAFKAGFEEGLSKLSSPNITNAKSFSLELVSIPAKAALPTSSKAKAIYSYLEAELKNKKLGLLGEFLVVESERAHLISNGLPQLAGLVKHVSVEIGDGLGYDILSYDLQGNKKMIEVKTTRSNEARPFFITRNELNQSRNNPDNFYLYRIFDFDLKTNSGKCYVLKGDMAKLLQTEPLSFIALPK